MYRILKKIKNKKGMTLPEVLIAFVLISMVMVWVTQSVPIIRLYNSTETNRVVSLTRNINSMELMRNNLYETGSVRKLSPSEMSGEEYGTGIYYSTYYEENGFEAASDPNSDLRKIIDLVLTDTSLEELRPRDGASSELYRITLNTTVAQKQLPRSAVTSFIYANTSPTSNIKTDGLVFWLNADGYSNSDSNKEIAHNRAGGSITGTLKNFGFNATSGWTGNSLKFDGIDDTIEIPESSNMKPDVFAIEAYVKPENKGTRHLIFTTWYGYTLEINADKTVSFGVYNNGAYLKTAPVVEWGEYIHIAAVSDGMTQKIYIDGEVVVSKPITNPPIYTAGQPIDISSTIYDEFKGEVMDIKFYNTILLDAEVQRNYNNIVGDL